MTLPWILLAAVTVMGAGCASNNKSLADVGATVRVADQELTRREFLTAVLRYLNQWHLDSETMTRLAKAGQIEVWVRMLDVKTDEGDRSRFAELWLPGAGLLVDLKQSDHEVPERRLVLRDSGFKIRAVQPLVAEPDGKASWSVVLLPSSALSSQLFQSRAERLFPNAALEALLRDRLSEYLRQHHECEWLGGVQTFYAAPQSPVCNELWLYWENQQMALRFAADGDLADPRLWDQLSLHLRAVKLDEHVADSPPATAGARRSVSRDWAGRLLYNCLVLGRKFTLSSAAAGPR